MFDKEAVTDIYGRVWKGRHSVISKSDIYLTLTPFGAMVFFFFFAIIIPVIVGTPVKLLLIEALKSSRRSYEFPIHL